ncbi:uncharacterized protein LOC133131295 isoform X2 [Conger conger]|uniref:uncharacterized protein LOC133131295 isoform X2 n=1 Tax=Conger conger TaxID=82655 RepID=UPI002A59ECAE|nr:uncharacterized protein LOC133131295 isoform X2 [Conger conger]
MDLLYASLLLLLIGQAQGATYFLYQTKNNKEIMVCKHRRWQIDINYDYKVDCRATSNEESSEESSEERSHDNKCKNIKKSLEDCTRNNTQAEKATSCLAVKPEENNGYFACVDNFQSKFLYPFKSADQNDYFILAFAKPKVLKSQPETQTHIIHEGWPIILTCHFSISDEFSNCPYIVYWIKTGGKGSTCIYSYDFDLEEIKYNFYCSSENNLRTRISNTSSHDPMTNIGLHNLTINRSTHLDSGQYVCALNVIKENKGNWVVISTVDVTVHKKELSNQDTTRSKAYFTPLYLAVALVIIGTFVIVIYMKKKSNIAAKESQFVSNQRHQNEDETINLEISPYTVAGRLFEPYSVVKLTDKPADHSAAGDQAKPPTELYSTVGVTPGAHVYESISDTHSRCK